MNTLFVGQNRINLDHVDSTNKYLANHVNLTDLPEGSMVVAHEQFEGKGQRNKVWRSDPGKNMTLSVMLRPKFLDVQNYFIFNKGVTLAVLNTIEELVSEEVWIKWPNDIIVQNKKIAGILVELNWRSSNCLNAIIGVGINVNQTNFDGLPYASSLKSLSNREFEIENVIQLFIQNLEYQYLQMRKKEWDTIIIAYNNRLWDRGEYVMFDREDEVFQGMLKGVGNDGKLKMIVQNKEVSFNHGEIKLRYRN